MSIRSHKPLAAAILGALCLAWSDPLSLAVQAQSLTRKGVLTQSLVRSLVGQSTTLTQGRLADLQTDPNFVGDLRVIVNDAAKILDGYTIVERGGGFPENRGIPRSQQLAKVEVVYSIYTLDNGLELFLYRSPTENTSFYFIRTKR
jgi:hypothetical protein